jgi:RNA polymerase sigma factor (sigma-70 family)
VYRSDPKLIEACRAGDQNAWNELIDRYGRLVYSIPRRYGLREADADDVFQSVLTILFRKLANLNDQTRLSAWLITTTHRECWRIGRRSGEAATLADLDHQIVDVGSPAQALAEQWERQHLVRAGLAILGGRCRDLLTALFLEPGEPRYDMITRRLNMKMGSIGPTRARCFKKLEKILADLGFDHGSGGAAPAELAATGKDPR